jgi:hypothetical protein
MISSAQPRSPRSISVKKPDSRFQSTPDREEETSCGSSVYINDRSALTLSSGGRRLRSSKVKSLFLGCNEVIVNIKISPCRLAFFTTESGNGNGAAKPGDMIGKVGRGSFEPTAAFVRFASSGCSLKDCTRVRNLSEDD